MGLGIPPQFIDTLHDERLVAKTELTAAATNGESRMGLLVALERILRKGIEDLVTVARARRRGGRPGDQFPNDLPPRLER